MGACCTCHASAGRNGGDGEGLGEAKTICASGIRQGSSSATSFRYIGARSMIYVPSAALQAEWIHSSWRQTQLPAVRQLAKDLLDGYSSFEHPFPYDHARYVAARVQLELVVGLGSFPFPSCATTFEVPGMG